MSCIGNGQEMGPRIGTLEPKQRKRGESHGERGPRGEWEMIFSFQVRSLAPLCIMFQFLMTTGFTRRIVNLGNTITSHSTRSLHGVLCVFRVWGGDGSLIVEILLLSWSNTKANQLRVVPPSTTYMPKDLREKFSPGIHAHFRSSFGEGHTSTVHFLGLQKINWIDKIWVSRTKLSLSDTAYAPPKTCLMSLQI